jgi:hypothetical protein
MLESMLPTRRGILQSHKKYDLRREIVKITLLKTRGKQFNFPWYLIFPIEERMRVLSHPRVPIGTGQAGGAVPGSVFSWLLY